MKPNYLLALVVIGIVLVSGCAQQGANAGKPASTSGEQASEQSQAQQTPQSERELEMQERSAQQSAAQESQKETVPASSTGTPNTVIEDNNMDLKIISASCGRNSDGSSYVRGVAKNMGTTSLQTGRNGVMVCYIFKAKGNEVQGGWIFGSGEPLVPSESRGFQINDRTTGWDSCVVYACHL